MSNSQPLQPHHGEVPHHDAPYVTPTEAFLEKNFRKIILLAVVVVAVASVVFMIRYKSRQTANAAAEQVSAAKTVEDCDLVVQKYPGSTAAGNAMLLKADLLWKANKKDSAVGVLKDFTKSFSKHPFHLSGLMGLASKLEAIGEKSEAKAIYERVTSEYAKSEFAPLAQVRLGDLLWSDGKEEEAKKLFESLPSKYPGELSVSMSQQRLDLIAAGLPTKEVDGPPPPKKEDKPAGAAAGSPPINLKPGGVTPIKLDAGLGAKGTLSPTAPAPPSPAPSVPGTSKIVPPPAPPAPTSTPGIKVAPPAPTTPPPAASPSPAKPAAPAPAGADAKAPVPSGKAGGQ